MYSPKWLFLYPGIILTTIGILGGIFLMCGSIVIGSVTFSIHSLLYCMIALIVGINIVYYYVFTKMYAEKSHFIPHDRLVAKIAEFSEDRGILLGVFMTFIGFVTSIVAITTWSKSGFGEMNPEELMRWVIPSATLIELGVETIFASFFMGILKISWRKDK